MKASADQQHMEWNTELKRSRRELEDLQDAARAVVTAYEDVEYRIRWKDGEENAWMRLLDALERLRAAVWEVAS